jgi:hypothetical protein
LGYFQMKDINSRIKAGNTFLKSQDWSTLNPVHLGFNFTGDLRARVTRSLSFSVGAGASLARSQIDFKQVITVRPSATFYHVRAQYLLPWRPLSSSMFSIGAGPVYFPKAKLQVTHEIRLDDNVGYERTVTAGFEGKGWGAHAYLQSETVLNQKTTLLLDLGYRLASISRDASKDTWKISGIRDPLADGDGDGIPNQWDLNATENPNDPATRRDLPSYMTESFLQVEQFEGRPRTDAKGKPYVTAKGKTDIDFSGVVLNVGLRFYLF